MSNVVSTITIPSKPIAIQPVKLKSITAEKNDDDPVVKWITEWVKEITNKKATWLVKNIRKD